MQVVRLKFVKKFIKLIKITNCVCGRICNGCDVAVVRAHHSNVTDKPQCVTVHAMYPSELILSDSITQICGEDCTVSLFSPGAVIDAVFNSTEIKLCNFLVS